MHGRLSTVRCITARDVCRRVAVVLLLRSRCAPSISIAESSVLDRSRLLCSYCAACPLGQLLASCRVVLIYPSDPPRAAGALGRRVPMDAGPALLALSGPG